MIRVETRGDSVVKRAPAPVSRAARRMLRREFWLLSTLRPTRAPRALDIGPGADGSLELMVERLGGVTAEATLAAGDRLGLAAALIDVAQALHELHVAGHVHGDVAPRNVLVEGRGAAARGWLIDFGFAAREGCRPALVRGTPATMAPEVAGGEPVRSNADLYSLGCLLRAALRGWIGAGGRSDGDLGPDLGAAQAFGSSDLEELEALARELRATDPAARTGSAHDAGSRLAAALALGRAMPGATRTPRVLGLRPGLEWSLLRAIGRLAAGGEGGGIALVGAGGSGRRSLLRIAERAARAQGVELVREPSHLVAQGARPALVIFDPGEESAVSARLSEHARLPGVLALAGLRRPPADPALRVLALQPLDLGASVRLGRALLRSAHIPSDAAGEAGRVLQPGAWGRRLRAATPRRNARGDVIALPRRPAATVSAERASAPALAGFCGDLLERARLERLFRERGAAESGAVAIPLSDRSPAEVFRWVAGLLGRARACGLARAAAGALLEPHRGDPTLRRHRAAWLLRSAGALRSHVDLAQSVAEQDAGRGRPRSAIAMARSLLPLLEPGRPDHLRALGVAVDAARRLGRPRLALRWLDALPPPSSALQARALALERVETLILCGDVEAAWAAAAPLREPGASFDARESLALARVAELRGESAPARRWAGSVLGPARRADPSALARALVSLAATDLSRGDLFRAGRRSRRALAIRRTLADPAGVAACLVQLADVDDARRDPAAARSRLSEALDLRLAAGQVAGAADILERIGRSDAAAGEGRAARRRFSRALELRERLGDSAGSAAARHNLGILALRDGDAEAARRASIGAAQLFDRLGELRAELAARTHGALAAEALGRRRAATLELMRVLRRRRRCGDRRGTVVALKHLGDVLRRGGRGARAARLAWIAVVRAGDDGRRRHELLLDATEAEADAGRIDAAWAALGGVEGPTQQPHIRLRAALLASRLGAAAPAPERLAALVEGAGARAHAALAAAAAALLVRAERPELARAILHSIGDHPLDLFARVAVDLAWVELHLATGSSADPSAPLLRARRLVERLGLVRERAHLLFLEAELLIAAGRAESARGHLDEAEGMLGPPPRHPELRVRIARRRRAGARAPDRRQHLALVRVTDLLGSIEDPEQLFRAILRVVLDTVAAERGVLTLREGQSDHFEIAVARNVEPQAIDDVQRISRSILTRSIREGAVLHSSNALQDDEFRGLRSVQLYRIVAFACAPLVVGGRIIGTIYVDRRSPGGAFSPHDLDFLASLARISAIALEHARLHDRLRTQAGALRREMAAIHGLDSLLRRSRPMTRVMTQARRLVDVPTPILLLGETGVGKSALARAIHYSGARAGGPFVELDCGAIPETLIESELFGHVRGAFTDAHSDRPGAFAQADGGTLLLDEIGNLPPAGQAKLLRVLQDRRLRPVGGDRAREVDVRVICATNADLERRVQEGSFRGDLFFRIHTVPLLIPPLRERRADIIPLAERFLHQTAPKIGRKAPELDVSLRKALRLVPWPGNVRQLENVLHRLLVLEPSDCWSDVVLPEELRAIASTAAGPAPGISAPARVERSMLIEALGQCRWNRRRVAERLGLTHRQVCYRIEKYGLVPPPRPSSGEPR